VKAFRFLRPRSAHEAARVLGENQGALIKAGGIDLLDRMKERIDTPDAVVGLVDATGLDEITIDDDGAIVIGARVTLAQLADAKVCREFLPTLAEAAGEAASPQIRNLATIAGNIAQRNRCGYYRHASFPCLRRGDDVCPVKAEGGVQDTAGVFDGDCVAAHPSSIAPVLGSLDAEVVVRRGGALEALPFERIWAKPAKGRASDLALAGDALIEAIRIPGRLRKQHAGYAEIRQKAAFDWAMVSCAVRYETEGDMGPGKMRDVRIWFGAVAPTPLRAREAEQRLTGVACTDETAAAAAEVAFIGARPLPGAVYKVALGKVALRRALAAARERGA
jgi:xanthine dehydrogenase YagS FAD-binding subunit